MRQRVSLGPRGPHNESTFLRKLPIIHAPTTVIHASTIQQVRTHPIHYNIHTNIPTDANLYRNIFSMLKDIIFSILEFSYCGGSIEKEQAKDQSHSNVHLPRAFNGEYTNAES